MVNTGHVKTKGVVKLDSFEHIRWYSSAEADKYSSCYLFLSLSEQVVYFHETDYSIIYSHYLQLLQRFFTIGVLETLYTIHRKTTVSEPLFNQPVDCYFFNKTPRHKRFLVDLAKQSRISFLEEHIETILILYLWNIYVTITS